MSYHLDGLSLALGGWVGFWSGWLLGSLMMLARQWWRRPWRDL